VTDTETYRARIVESLKNTVFEVMGTMALAEVTATDIGESEEFLVSGPAAGLMLLAGERPGMVAVSMSESLVRGVVAGITGAAPESLSRQDLLDGIAEIVNMLCGGMKTKVADAGIQLSPPLAVLGNDCTLAWKTDRPTGVLTFEMSGESFTVHVCAL